MVWTVYLDIGTNDIWSNKKLSNAQYLGSWLGVFGVSKGQIENWLGMVSEYTMHYSQTLALAGTLTKVKPNLCERINMRDSHAFDCLLVAVLSKTNTITRKLDADTPSHC